MKTHLLFFILSITLITIKPLVGMEKKTGYKNLEKYGDCRAEKFADFLEDFSKAQGDWAHISIAVSLKKEVALMQGISDGWTPLHWAVSKGYTNAVTTLLKAVSLAQESGYKQHNVYALIAYATTEKKDTALHLATKGNHLNIAIKLLAAAPTRKDACHVIALPNFDGHTSLEIALAEGFENMHTLFKKYHDDTVSDDDLKAFVTNLTT